MNAMMRMTFSLLVAVSLLMPHVAARSASETGPTASPHLTLAGTAWHTVHIDGDALFFLIDELGIRFDKDGRFTAQVRFVDGQQHVKRGTYQAEDQTIIVTIDGGKPKTIEYWTDRGNLVVRDKAYDVTARLAPGKMEDEGWF